MITRSAHLFGSAMRALGRRRLGLSEVRIAFLHTHPEAANAPDPRRQLLDALRTLEAEGAVILPRRGWDTSGVPALPRTVTLRVDTPAPAERQPQAWLPALAFAADERHPARRKKLKAINAFLVSVRGSRPVPVPTRERSLHIFGDEKQLDILRKGGTSLFDGKVRLDDLHCYPVAPPLPYEPSSRHEAGRWILVLENYHCYDSFCRWNHRMGLYAAIAYGGGNAFRQGAGNLDVLIDRTQADGAFYLGDLDPAGVRILAGVNGLRQSQELPPIHPHRGLYSWLLAHGHRRPLKRKLNKSQISELVRLFPADIASGLAELWSAAQCIPQESFGMMQLTGHDEKAALPEAA